MKRALLTLLPVIAIFFTSPVSLIGGTESGQAWAAERMVALSVPDMTCLACPITVRTCLERVDGVLEAEVSFEDLKAVVTYDPERTGVSELIEATANVGYPSSVIVE